VSEVPLWLSALGLAARWIHLVACVILVGTFAQLLLVGRSDRPTVQAWESRLLGWARGLVLLGLATGVLALQYQTAVLVGAPEAALDRAALGRVLLETHGGRVWLVRHGLLLLLAAFLLARPDVERRLDWAAVRGESLLLGGSALALLALAGHAVAVEAGTALAVVVDLVHLAAVGVWAGGLLPLATLLRAASREGGSDARPFAVLAARRFSRCALTGVLLLGSTGAVNAAVQIGGFPALVGTPYGRLLMLKLGLVLPVVALGAANRSWLLPALSGEAALVGRPAMRRLGGFVVVELALALAILAIVVVMTATPPARHVSPVWPFSFRLAPGGIADTQANLRALVGSQLAVLGLVALAAAALVRVRRLPLLGLAFVLLGIGTALTLPPITVDAYPTTYRRPAVPYTAASIVAGATLYAEHCASCHGPDGRGDGPAGRALPRRPPDLRGPHTADHTAGDLFWWITRGITSGGMPAFENRLAEEERWDVVNAVRALGDAEKSRALGGSVEPGRAWLVAPDFTYAIGPGTPHALKEYRGRRIVVLVIYSLPASRARLAELAEAYGTLVTLGVEVIAVPADASPNAIRELGVPVPVPVLFPIVTDGAADIAGAYRLFGQASHAVFLIDRQGYLRARWLSDGRGPDLNTVLAEVQELNAEKIIAPLPAEHVH
jgi:putative copper export protein/mono/diheme cytochrome c family protein/peroxiredoxin